MIKRLWISCLFLTMGIGSAFAQSKVFIYVTDENKEPLDMVGISVSDENTEYLNQTFMYFPASIELKKGTYIITATRYGYLQKTDTLVVKESEQIFTVVMKTIAQEVSVGSVKAAPQNIQPGSIYTIDQDFIKACGARDINDVLMALPGFTLGLDVLGNINHSTRGVWTNEGKFMFMVDGVMFNELAYGTMQLGQRFPIHNIDRIEILRGPASITNGGLASYGVINIVTKKHTDGNKLSFCTLNGKTDHAVSRQGYQFLYTDKLGSDGYLNLSGYLSRGIRSDKKFTDFSGNTADLANNSNLSNEQLILNAGYKTLKITGVLDNYQIVSQDGYGLNSRKSYAIRFPVAGLHISSAINLGQKWKITPQISFLSQKPYSGKDIVMDSLDEALIGRTTLYDFTTINRLSNNFVLSYETGRLELDFKGEYLQDFFKNNEELFPNLANYFEMKSLIGLGNIKVSLLDPVRLNQKQALYLQAAVRGEKQTYYSAVVPQASFTLLSGVFHAKLLAGRSFRPPLLENIRLNIANSGVFTLKPDYTNTYELELGFDIGEKSYLTVNAYQNKTSGVISFNTDLVGNQNYINGPVIGTSGLEMHSRFVMGPVSLYLNSSMYKAAKTTDSFYLSPGTHANTGVPQVKLNTYLSFDFESMMGLNGTKLNLGYTFLGSQYQYADGSGKITTISDKSYLNTILDIDNIGNGGLNLSLGIYDLLNQGLYYVQPYNGGHATMPGTGREYLLKLSYDLAVK